MGLGLGLGLGSGLRSGVWFGASFWSNKKQLTGISPIESLFLYIFQYFNFYRGHTLCTMRPLWPYAEGKHDDRHIQHASYVGAAQSVPAMSVTLTDVQPNGGLSHEQAEIPILGFVLYLLFARSRSALQIAAIRPTSIFSQENGIKVLDCGMCVVTSTKSCAADFAASYLPLRKYVASTMFGKRP